MKNFIAVLFTLLSLCASAHAQTGQLQAGQIWGNPSASAKPATGTTVGVILDREYTCTGRGSLIMRGASFWGCFAPGATAGWPLTTTGTGTDLAFARMGLGALATGTQDTVIGYWGSTTASAIAMNNCTGALTYSTGTHTFGCNATAGTGNVVVSGTPTVNQFGLWVNATTIQGTDAATKTVQQTGTSATNPVTPLQQQSHDSAAKAWGFYAVNAPPANASLLRGYNVGTLTHPSTGNWVLTFPTPFSATNDYGCSFSTQSIAAPNTVQISSTASTVTFYTLDSSGVGADGTAIFVHCFGRQ